jgi:hypothetical protein
MPAQLKHAWLDLVTAVAVAVVYFALLPFVGPERATVAIALMAIGAFAPLFYRKPRGSAAVLSDERDRLIHLRSLAVSWVVMWLFFVAFCMITWQRHHGGTVRAEVFPLMVTVGWILVTISRALVTVLLYRRQA